MAGIYIPGMEMPTNCCECPVALYLCKIGYQHLLKHEELYDERAKDCPLIPVPAHGRLISAELLKADFTGNFTEAYPPGLIWAMIDDAPTIIPADNATRSDCRTCVQDCQFIGCDMPRKKNCDGYIPAEEEAGE